jgi:hypothetical protein
MYRDVLPPCYVLCWPPRVLCGLLNFNRLVEHTPIYCWHPLLPRAVQAGDVLRTAVNEAALLTTRSCGVFYLRDTHSPDSTVGGLRAKTPRGPHAAG